MIIAWIGAHMPFSVERAFKTGKSVITPQRAFHAYFMKILSRTVSFQPEMSRISSCCSNHKFTTLSKNVFTANA